MFLFRFKTFIAPVFIRFLYYVGLVVIVFSGVVLTVMGMNQGGDLVALYPIGGLLYIVFSIFFWRFMIEAWLVIFEINDRLGRLVERETK